MTRSKARVLVVLVGFTLVCTLSHSASAQGRRGGFGFGRLGSVSRVQLTTLENVQSDLKLNDDQKAVVAEVNEKLGEQRRELFQGGGGGDFAAMREKMDKLNAEASAKVAAKLDDAQKARLTEIFVQVNGASSLTDEEVSAALKVSDDQKKGLADAEEKNGAASREAFQGFRDMSNEERQEVMAKVRKEADERLLSVLTAEQKEQFGKMKGKEIEIDRSQLRGGRGGRGRRGGGA